MIRTDKPAQWADTEMAPRSPAPRIPRMPGCGYQSQHQQAAEPCTDIGADTEEATMGFTETVAWWLPVFVPLAVVPAVALLLAYWDELFAWVMR